MTKNPKLLLAAGAIVLALGLVLQFTGSATDADAQLQQRCEETMRTNDAGQEMVDRCAEATFAIATTATDANAAAKAISVTNTGDIAGNALSMFMIGLGLVLVLGALLAGRKRAM